MRLTLDSRTFKRMVVAHLLLLPLTAIFIVAELSISPWQEFSDAFDEMVSTYFRQKISDEFWIAVGLVALLANVSGAIGLIKFRVWAPPVFIGSFIFFFVLDILYGLPTYVSPLSNFVMFLDYGIFGAIVLLCFSRAHWNQWTDSER